MCPASNQIAVASGESSEFSKREPDRIQAELTALSNVLGRKWNLVIIERLLANGPLGFSGLLEDIDGISSKVLSESLDDLEASGLVDREIVNERPIRVEYSLTQQGAALEWIIEKVREGSLTVTAHSEK
ncbi:winged helix-turn-helix transcriptional regulator [Natrinema salsiterrestre]|uniref:Helix-turn-helix transcriptional regulator n=1 Tax=Natrinema salsiterrestre TaxID=2950540 RepID=A0A9Q4Q473_9EURY|nr:helix-turn-helix domain-containing protein [Natrinema salsiterrestre]MDF9746928.1 helix-turn-helix transcriptional regulator [Natrinema salsiterrestre]